MRRSPPCTAVICRRRSSAQRPRLALSPPRDTRALLPPQSLILAIDINAFGGFYGPLYGNVATALNRTQAAQAAAAALLAGPAALDDDSSGRRAALASEAEYDAYWGAYYGAAALEEVPIYTGATGDAVWSTEFTNSLFILAAFIHFVNAWQYAYAWHGRRWNDVVLYPEYMNIIGSWLYLM